MLNEILVYSTVTLKLMNIKLGMFNFEGKKCTNTFIRKCLIHECYPGPVKKNDIFQPFHLLGHCEIWSTFEQQR